MKKRFERIIAAIILLVAAIVSGSNIKKEGSPYVLYITKSGSCIAVGYIISSPYLTTGGLGLQMTMSTANAGIPYKVFSSSSCSASSQVHFNP